MTKSKLNFFIVSLTILSGCASVPKGTSAITIEGVQSRTGIAIPTENQNVTNGKVNLPPNVSIDRALTSDDAAAIALWNNPQFNIDLAALGLSRGDLMDAGQLRNPRLDMLFPLGLKPFELLLNLPLEAIWERPARVAAAEKAYEQLAQSLVQNALNTVQEARTAHANLILAQKRQAILTEASELRKRISKINNNQRVQLGELTQAEGIATEVDSASAEDVLARANHDTYLAKERLRFVLGLVFEKTNLEVTATNVEVNTPIQSENLEAKAIERRPDLRAAEIGIHAAAKRADWEDARIAQLSVLLSSKGVGYNGLLTGPGVSLEVPIFHQNNGRRARADADVELATRQFFGLRQRVVFEVREARELLIQAQEVLATTRKEVLPLLEKTVRIAEREYKRRAASYLFVLEQTRSLIDAKIRAAEFEAAVVRAEAQLKRAIGGDQ